MTKKGLCQNCKFHDPHDRGSCASPWEGGGVELWIIMRSLINIQQIDCYIIKPVSDLMKNIFKP